MTAHIAAAPAEVKSGSTYGRRKRKGARSSHAAEGEREEKAVRAHGLADAHDALVAAADADLLLPTMTAAALAMPQMPAVESFVNAARPRCRRR